MNVVDYVFCLFDKVYYCRVGVYCCVRFVSD